MCDAQPHAGLNGDGPWDAPATICVLLPWPRCCTASPGRKIVCVLIDTRDTQRVRRDLHACATSCHLDVEPVRNPTLTYCSTNPHWRERTPPSERTASRLRCCMRHRASCLRNAPGGTPRISGPLPEGVGPWPGRTEDGSEQQVHSTSCLSRFDCRGGMSGQGAAVNRTRLPPATPSTTLRRRASSCTRWDCPVRPTAGRTTHADCHVHVHMTVAPKRCCTIPYKLHSGAAA